MRPTSARIFPVYLSFPFYRLEQFSKFLRTVKELEYDEKPDYRRIRHEFRVLYMDNYGDDHSLFDWQIGSAAPPVQKVSSKLVIAPVPSNVEASIVV